MPAPLACSGVHKSYGDHVRTARRRPARRAGGDPRLPGPNRVPKTTAIGIALGLLQPHQRGNGARARRRSLVRPGRTDSRCGYLPSSPSVSQARHHGGLSRAPGTAPAIAGRVAPRRVVRERLHAEPPRFAHRPRLCRTACARSSGDRPGAPARPGAVRARRAERGSQPLVEDAFFRDPARIAGGLAGRGFSITCAQRGRRSCATASADPPPGRENANGHAHGSPKRAHTERRIVLVRSNHSRRRCPTSSC